jgi:hypothetical protein
MGFTHNLSIFFKFLKKRLDLGFRDCCTFLSPYLSGDFSSFHTNSKDPPDSQKFAMLLLWYFVVQNHHVLWCKKVPKKDCYGARKYPRKIVMVHESTQERLLLWFGKQVFLLGLTRYVPHFVPLPIQPMRRLSIGTLSSHEGSSFGGGGGGFSPVPNVVLIMFTWVFPKSSPSFPRLFPPPRHSFPIYAQIFATYTYTSMERNVMLSQWHNLWGHQNPWKYVPFKGLVL